MLFRSGQFAAAWGSGPNAAHPYSATFWTLLGNVFFLQTLTTPVWGSNGPLWSLAYEFWYYVCFPLLAYALGLTGRPLSTIRRLLCGVSVVALFIALPQDVRTGFLVWMVGVCVYVIQNTWQHQARPLALAGTVVLFVAS